MLSDIEIAQAAKMQPITEIAANLGLQGEDVIPYGHYKAKLNHKLAKADKPEGKLILVTAISPTPAGEGKTTTSVGLADAMNASLRKLAKLPIPRGTQVLPGHGEFSTFGDELDNNYFIRSAVRGNNDLF